MGIFNSREIATAIWLAVVLFWILSKSQLRSSAKGLIRALCSPKILLVFSVSLLATAFIVFELWNIGFWKSAQFKDTIIWFLMTGISFSFRGVGKSDPEQALRASVHDSVKIVIIIEFLSNTYTFPLAVELILLPILALLSGILVFAEADKENIHFASFVKLLLSLFGLFMLAFVFWRFIRQPNQAWSLESLRNFALPIVLTIAYLPVAYFVALCSEYGQIFIQLKLGREKPRQVIWYAKCKLLLVLGPSLSRVHNASERIKPELRLALTCEQIDRAILKLARAENRAQVSDG